MVQPKYFPVDDTGDRSRHVQKPQNDQHYNENSGPDIKGSRWQDGAEFDCRIRVYALPLSASRRSSTILSIMRETRQEHIPKGIRATTLPDFDPTSGALWFDSRIRAR